MFSQVKFLIMHFRQNCTSVPLELSIIWDWLSDR